jgi:UDPglucose 6-dehydrogenase
MIITVIGAGYVGLVSAAVFSDLGNTVNVIDIIPERIENLKKGIIPIYEPGLGEMVKYNYGAGRLKFTLDYSPAVQESDIIIIAVGTPPKEDGNADLTYIFDAAKKIAQNLKDYTVVITKSTVPVGTSKEIRAVLDIEKSENASYDYASIPEFLREGQAISDTLHPDRVVIGVDSKKAEKLLIELNQPILADGPSGSSNLVVTSIPTAEMIKYASNAFLATKISFANAIAQMSELTGANGVEVLKAVGHDKRIGKAFLNAGAGYGGSCFPKDVQALIAIAKNYDYDFALLQEVENINKAAVNNIAIKAEKLLAPNFKDKTVGFLGLSFKPDTDDMRFAPSVPVILKLLEKGVTVNAYDPIAINNAKRVFDKNAPHFVNDPYSAAKDADLLIVITEWNEFRNLNLAKIKELMKQPQLIDGRNIYDPKMVKELGFTYIGVGR